MASMWGSGIHQSLGNTMMFPAPCQRIKDTISMMSCVSKGNMFETWGPLTSQMLFAKSGIENFGHPQIIKCQTLLPNILHSGSKGIKNILGMLHCASALQSFPMHLDPKDISSTSGTIQTQCPNRKLGWTAAFSFEFFHLDPSDPP